MRALRLSRSSPCLRVCARACYDIYIYLYVHTHTHILSLSFGSRVHLRLFFAYTYVQPLDTLTHMFRRSDFLPLSLSFSLSLSLSLLPRSTIRQDSTNASVPCIRLANVSPAALWRLTVGTRHSRRVPRRCSLYDVRSIRQL